MKKNKKIKRDRGIFFKIVRFFIKRFKRKIIFINPENIEIEKQGIYLSNHNGAGGPVNYSIFFPLFYAPWAAGDVQGTYRERWNYLYFIFYRKKKGWGKFASFILATLFGIVSRALYLSARTIPTYTDNRFLLTVRRSAEYIDANVPVLIFPEDSEQGYFEKLKHVYSGFVLLSEFYYRTRKIDLPVYPLHINRRKGIIQIGQPYYVNKMLQEGKTKEEIAEFFKDKINELGENLNKIKIKK